MNSDTQLKVQAYLDNELSSGEARKVAGLLSSDAEVKELFNHLRATREILVGNEPEHKLEESREFYWSKIQREIEKSERAPAVKPSNPWWIRLLAPLAGTVALFALVLSVMNPKDDVVRQASLAPEAVEASDRLPLHGEVEDLAPEMTSVTFRSDQHGVTVVWLTASK